MQSIIPNRSIIKVTGSDAVKFLQNLVTNDVNLTSLLGVKRSSLGDVAISGNTRHSGFRQDEVSSLYAMMLSPQGRFLFDMFIIKTDEGFLLDVFSDTQDLLLKKLRMYKINLQVEIDHMHEWCVGYAARRHCEASEMLRQSPVVSYKDPRYEALGYRFIDFHVDDGGHAYLEDKYKYSIPDGGIDLLYDKAMPQEYGAEQLNAISYTKGCYVGQEVISRTKSQGVVRKKIYKVLSDHTLDKIPHGTEITQDGNKVGIFCSGYGLEGIALLREENLISNEAELGGAKIKLQLAEWYSQNP